MEDHVHRPIDVDVLGDVVVDELEARVAEQVSDVAAVPGREIVEGDDLVALADQPIRQMRSDEPCPTRDDDPPHAHSARTAGRPMA
jgi:hypothetical protein